MKMFYGMSVISDVEGSFTFGHDRPNWLDTFFRLHFGGLLLPSLPLGTEMSAQLPTLGKLLTIIGYVIKFWRCDLVGRWCCCIKALVAQRLKGDDDLAMKINSTGI